MLHDLENNEAVLLMYLAGELPPEDRAEVEQQLAADAGLRAEFQRLRELNDVLTQTLSEADGVAIPATKLARESAAVRRVSRAMVRYRLQQQEQTTVQEQPRRRLRLPSWTYPFAAAAMLLIAYVAWWGFTNSSTTGRDVGSGMFANGLGMDETGAAAVVASLESDSTDRQALVVAEDLDDAAADLGALLRAVGREEDLRSSQ